MKKCCQYIYIYIYILELEWKPHKKKVIIIVLAVIQTPVNYYKLVAKTWNKVLQMNSHQWDKHLGSTSFKILWTILKMSKRGTKTNRPEDKKLMIMHKTKHSRHDRNRLYVSRKGGRVFTSIKDCVDVSLRWFEVNIKKMKERLITATSNRTGIRTNRTTTKTRRQKLEENNYMDISNDKLMKSHTRWLGHGYEKETLKVKLNLFKNSSTKQRHRDQLY